MCDKFKKGQNVQPRWNQENEGEMQQMRSEKGLGIDFRDLTGQRILTCTKRENNIF